MSEVTRILSAIEQGDPRAAHEIAARLRRTAELTLADLSTA
jgi:hypothetical protein